MAARTKNNLDEIQRRYNLPSATAPVKQTPSTPQARAASGKPKFKKATTSIATSTPSNITVRKLPSFSTPGFNKPKASPLLSTSAADNSLSVIDISSTETTPLNASTSSIPVKRLSIGPPDELISRFSPKRAKTDHSSTDKENSFRPNPSIKGKGRAREPSASAVFSTNASSGQSSSYAQISSVTSAHNNSIRSKTGAAELRSAFEALPHDADLEEKSQEDLRAAITSAQDFIEFCDKQVGLARVDAGEPRDVGLCNLFSDFLEKRLCSARALLKAIQRGERPAAGRAASVGHASLPNSTEGMHGDVRGSGQPSSASQHVSAPITPASDPPRPRQEVTEADDEYWEPFDDDAVIDAAAEPAAPAVLTPATPPATQPRLPMAIRDVPPVAPPLANAPVVDPPDLMTKPYYRQVKDTLRNTFGLQAFRALQLKAICEVMDGRDVFVLFPTGSGKSLTFQLPAVVQDGLTVVISPLKSLITDQYNALKARGVDVEMLLGEMSDTEKRAVWQRLGSDNKPPDLLYITPEMLQMNGAMRNALTRLLNRNKLRRFVIDEAHVITDWGRTFRDAYADLIQIRETYPNVPISALTATANAEVQEDIVKRLGLSIREPLKLSFNRQNLDYEVRAKKNGALADMAEFIKANYPRDTGIVYCSARDRCEEVAKALREKHNLDAKHYHAKMSEDDKNRVQEQWQRGEVKIMVATIAFGMGIDKADVRFVVHFDLPGSLKAYYQETGRAGRDGKLAHCILYYNMKDYLSRQRQIRNAKEIQDAERRWQEDELWHVMRYCTNNARCRRQQVLAYFDEVFDPVHCQQLCDNCRCMGTILTEDHTADAQNAVRLFENISKGRVRLTDAQFAAALRGSKQRDLVMKGITDDPLYGTCSHLSKHVVERLIEEMCYADVLSFEVVQNGSGYSNTYLTLDRKQANALKNGQKKFEIVFRDMAVGAGKGPAQQRKPPSRAGQRAPAAAPTRYDSPSAGPSRVPSRSSKKAYVPVAPPEPEKERSLFQDDPEDDVEWFEDEIEEISSPVPAARRMGTRAVPSASQSIAVGFDSDIEEVDAPTRVVTYIEKHDLPADLDLDPVSEDLDVQCRRELIDLREQLVVQERDEKMNYFLRDEAIGTLALMLPNDVESLRNVMEMVGFTMEDIKPHALRILSICTRFHMLRKSTVSAAGTG